MATPSTNKISLYSAVKIDGKPVLFSEKPLIDITPEQVVYIIPTLVTNYGGALPLVPAYEFVCQNPNGLTQDTYYLLVNATLPAMSDVLTALNTTISSDVTFTYYTELEQIDYLDVNTIPAYSSSNISYSAIPMTLIVNDAFMHDRTYIPNDNNTIVTVNCKNWLSKKKFTVNGNQSIAGTYTYFGA